MTRLLRPHSASHFVRLQLPIGHTFILETEFCQYRNAPILLDLAEFRREIVGDR